MGKRVMVRYRKESNEYQGIGMSRQIMSEARGTEIGGKVRDS